MGEEDVTVQVNMHEAKSQLSRLGKMAWSGQQVVIAKAGEPYLDLIPHHEKPITRHPGGYEGKIWMAEDFDVTPPEVIASFEGDS
jgi:antitoxin (DNA-binding transcriptional repressor) of toxin-antitoxin stability system